MNFVAPASRLNLAEPEAVNSGPSREEVFSFDPMKLARALQRRLWIILASMVVALLAAGAILSSATPRYTASALIMLDQSNVTKSLQDIVIGFEGDSTAIEAELAVMLSRRLLAQVGKTLSLERDPEFNAAQRERSPVGEAVATAKRFVRGLLIAAPQPAPATLDEGGAQSTTPNPIRLAADKEQAALGDYAPIVGMLSSRISAAQSGRSHLVEVSVQSEDPVKAAAIANTLIDTYIQDRLDARFEATRRVATWLAGRINILKANLEDSEAAVEEFQSGMRGEGGESVERLTRQISEITARLAAAEARYAEVSAEYSELRGLIDTGEYPLADALASEIADGYRTRLAALDARAAEIRGAFGPDHPRLAEIGLQIARLDEEIGREAARRVEALGVRVDVARAEVKGLEITLRGLEEIAASLTSHAVELRQIERDAEANRVIYESFLSKLKRSSEVNDLQPADARVISYATPPNRPSSPRINLTLALAIAAGGSIGIGLAFLLEYLSNTFTTAEQVRSETGMPVVADFSRVRGGLTDGAAVRKALARPQSAVADEARRARVALGLDSGPPSVLAVTSSLPREGRTSTCMLLGWACAQAGRRCLVIETDAPPARRKRDPRGADEPDLLSVLSGAVDLADAVARDSALGFDRLTLNRASEDLAASFASASAADALARARALYDVVILDAPPVFMRADGLAALRAADSILFLVRWRKTVRDSALESLGFIDFVGGDRPVSIALTMVDRRAEHLYRYGGFKSSYRAARRQRA